MCYVGPIYYLGGSLMSNSWTTNNAPVPMADLSMAGVHPRKRAKIPSVLNIDAPVQSHFPASELGSCENTVRDESKP